MLEIKPKRCSIILLSLKNMSIWYDDISSVDLQFCQFSLAVTFWDHLGNRENKSGRYNLSVWFSFCAQRRTVFFTPLITARCSHATSLSQYHLSIRMNNCSLHHFFNPPSHYLSSLSAWLNAVMPVGDSE